MHVIGLRSESRACKAFEQCLHNVDIIKSVQNLPTLKKKFPGDFKVKIDGFWTLAPVRLTTRAAENAHRHGPGRIDRNRVRSTVKV